MVTGNVDSSGMEFFYTDSAPEHLAGAFAVGHHPTPSMIIPPEVENFVITGVCHSSCTESVRECYSFTVLTLVHFSTQFFPEEGITVFGSLLHTHLAGIYNGISTTSLQEYLL